MQAERNLQKLDRPGRNQMSIFKTVKRAGLIVATVVILSGCGDTAPYVVSPLTLTFVGIVSPESTPPSQTVNVSVNEVVFLAPFCTAGSYIGSCTWAITGGTTAEIYVPVISAVTQGAGNHTGAQVIVIGCKDALCNEPHSNSPQLVDVNYNISPTFSFRESQSFQDIPVYPGSKGAAVSTLIPSTDGIKNPKILPVADPEAVFKRLGITQ